MDRADTDNVVKIWLKLVELHVFHEGLKQQRLSYFYNIQLGAAAGYAYLLLRDGLNTWRFIIAIGLAITGYLHSRVAAEMDRRAADYVTTVKSQTRIIEAKLEPILGVGILPYEGQFRVLNEFSIGLTASPAAYVEKHTKIATRIPASVREAWFLSYVSNCWIVAAILATLMGLAAVSLPHMHFMLQLLLDWTAGADPQPS